MTSTHELLDAGDDATNNQAYNVEGQLTTSHTSMNLSWNAAGLLDGVQVQGTEGGVYRYGYDCDGRRIWRKKEGQNNRTVFIYGGPNVITEVQVDDSTDQANDTKRYVYGTTIDDLLVFETDNDEQYGVTRNQQWSIMSLYDLSSGTIALRFNYGVFGQRYICDDDGVWNNSLDDLGLSYGYTSRRHDEDSGLMYFRARYYDPTTGEFISQDPLARTLYGTGYQDGMSLYRGYLVLNYIDPFGGRILNQQQEGLPPISPARGGPVVPADAPPAATGNCSLRINYGLPNHTKPSDHLPPEVADLIPFGLKRFECPDGGCVDISITLFGFKTKLTATESEPGGCVVNGIPINEDNINTGLTFLRNVTIDFKKDCPTGKRCSGFTLQFSTNVIIPIIIPINGGKCVLKGVFGFRSQNRFLIGECVDCPDDKPKLPPDISPFGPKRGKIK